MALTIARREIDDRRRGLVGWSLGILAMMAITIASFPSIRDTPGIDEFIEQLPDSVKALMGGADLDFASATGYVNARMLALLVPALFLVFVIGFGSRAVAGEHQDGRLDLVLSFPVKRRRLILEKVGVLAAVLLWFTTLVVLSLLIGGLTVDLGLTVSQVWPAAVMMLLFGLFFGLLALAAGCLTLERSLAITVPTVVALAGWLINSLAAIASWLEPARAISPLWWYSRINPLADGLDVGGAASLGAGAVIFLVVALLAFDRRDLA
jgi:ABC-2 type transport system permease protein